MLLPRALSALLLAFVAATLLSLACGDNGDDDNGELQGGPGNGGGPSTMLTVVAEDDEFDTDTITVPANTEVTIDLDNRDAGVLHNIAVYQSSDARDSIFVGELFAGVETVTYSFQSPAPGEYFFRCDVHPDTMTGTFIAE